MSGGIGANAVRAEVGPRLAALGAHYGACRAGAVSWWFPTTGRRERRLLFRPVRGLDEWEVEYAEHSADGRRTWVHGSRSIRCSRAGLGAAVDELVGAGLPRRPGRRLPDGGSGRPVVDGAAPGPRAAAAAAAAHRPPPPPRGVRVADGVLGVVVAVALLVACRVDIDLAPNIAAFAVPLLGVSAVWTIIGLSGAEHRRR
ncbi:hypothetical protein [Actinomycetospora termitidis]|uniref:Uncharacterized protein n=1 Tax=Actinomycetospora termitidis TaxID=3053470 RepID=A0ABT7M9K6_9PSEU|nr:hypothetical protein [Actinomycetospora sp. Odt1-22]MDL5157359.1 hypothetical protein [Actinomycetospora sp. Odt1-22]